MIILKELFLMKTPSLRSQQCFAASSLARIIVPTAICVASLCIAPKICNAQNTVGNPPNMPLPGNRTAVMNRNNADSGEVKHPFKAVESKNTHIEENYSVKYDFGEISQTTTKPIEKDFVLKNISNEPVTIDRVQVSCGCTSAVVDGGTPGAYQPIPVNGELKIHISIDPGHLYPGMVDKPVWVFLPNQNQPAYTLRIYGSLVPIISFMPLSLSYGTIKAGATPSMNLTVTTDNRYYNDKNLKLESNNDDVTLKLIGKPVKKSADYTERQYKVIVSKNAHLGLLQGTISAANIETKDNIPSRLSVFYFGRVEGDYSSEPDALIFNTIPINQATTKEITIVSKSADTLKGLKAIVKDANLSVKTLPVQADPVKSSMKLQVTLTPDKHGPHQSSIDLVSNNGQRLNIPVWSNCD